jgi:hypothetical protein
MSPRSARDKLEDTSSTCELMVGNVCDEERTILVWQADCQYELDRQVLTAGSLLVTAVVPEKSTAYKLVGIAERRRALAKSFCTRLCYKS